MAKPWARYQVGFIDHPKFQQLPSNAICLWIEGKNYADEHLTDGYLPASAIKKFRFYSKRNADLLLTSIGAKNAIGSTYAPLWKRVEGGVQMHDYLAHNEDANSIKARQEKADQKRQEDRQRKQEWRERREAERRTGERRQAASADCHNGQTVGPSTACHTGQPADGDATVPLYTDTDTDSDPNTPPYPPHGGTCDTTTAVLRAATREMASAHEAIIASEDVTDRAAAFLEDYPRVYAECRNGATYVVREARDFPTALDLVKAYPDRKHLRDMLRLFLKRNERDWNNQPGSPRQFAYYAPQCDADIRGARQRLA